MNEPTITTPSTALQEAKNTSFPFPKQEPPLGQFAPVPGPELEEDIAAQSTTPEAEWNVLATPPIYFTTRERQSSSGQPSVIHLRQLAKDGMSSDANASTARLLYGVTKSMLGFTPEEITTSQTKHGVPFEPSEIDPRFITVFRSLGELEAQWNSGQPLALFHAVVSALALPRIRMTPEDFYKAQVALLSTRR